MTTKFYVDINAHGEPCVWHNPDADPFVPVPVISKHSVHQGYWKDVVRKLTGECTVCPVRQHVVDTLADENRALHKSVRWHDLITDTVAFAAENWPQRPHAAAMKVEHEAGELVDQPGDITEAADVFIALCSWLAAKKHTEEELHAAAEAKMRVNKARTWERRGGSFQHVEAGT